MLTSDLVLWIVGNIELITSVLLVLMIVVWGGIVVFLIVGMVRSHNEYQRLKKELVENIKSRQIFEDDGQNKGNHR